ncbi:hypothetical protein [Mycoplasma sp. P36-A1]|uniref:hypothetical protein n=1 Tax=Mycoplasma sp. P36-A1 TaxID=3252900 RepID=UPI003C2E797E
MKDYRFTFFSAIFSFFIMILENLFFMLALNEFTYLDDYYYDIPIEKIHTNILGIISFVPFFKEDGPNLYLWNLNTILLIIIPLLLFVIYKIEKNIIVKKQNKKWKLNIRNHKYTLISLLLAYIILLGYNLFFMWQFNNVNYIAENNSFEKIAPIHTQLPDVIALNGYGDYNYNVIYLHNYNLHLWFILPLIILLVYIIEKYINKYKKKR